MHAYAILSIMIIRGLKLKTSLCPTSCYNKKICSFAEKILRRIGYFARNDKSQPAFDKIYPRIYAPDKYGVKTAQAMA